VAEATARVTHPEGWSRARVAEAARSASHRGDGGEVPAAPAGGAPILPKVDPHITARVQATTEVAIRLIEP